MPQITVIDPKDVVSEKPKNEVVDTIIETALENRENVITVVPDEGKTLRGIQTQVSRRVNADTLPLKVWPAPDKTKLYVQYQAPTEEGEKKNGRKPKSES